MARQRRDWKSKSDEEVIAYAKEHGFFGLSPDELSKKNSGDINYYGVLRRRGLIDQVCKRSVRDWKSKSDKEIIAYAKEHDLFGLSPKELFNKNSGDNGYYQVLRKRGLVDMICKRKRKEGKKWKSMINEELIAYGKEHDLFGLSPSELSNKNSGDTGYYQVLRKRGLIDQVCKRKIRKSINWKSKSDEELIIYAKEHGFFGLSPSELSNKNSGDINYYGVLRRRGLIDLVCEKRLLDWKSKSDEEMIIYAKERGFFGLSPSELNNKNSGDIRYYGVLKRRGLIDQVCERKIKKGKKWKSMTNEELIAYGKERDLFGLSPSELNNKNSGDTGYYSVLRKRRLIDRVCRRKIKRLRDWKSKSDEEIIAYGKEHDLFGLSPKELRNKDLGDKEYLVVLRKRGLVDIVCEKRLRDWKSKSDEEIIAYGKEHDLFGLSPSELSNKNSGDTGYYQVLRKRGLIDQVCKRKQNIKSEKSLIKALDSTQKAAYAVQLAGGDDVDLADVLAVIYDCRIIRKDVLKLLQKPSLRKYLGTFRKPEGINEIVESAEQLLPFDKDGVIRAIFKRRIENQLYGELGAMPSKEQKQSVLSGLEGHIYAVENEK